MTTEDDGGAAESLVARCLLDPGYLTSVRDGAGDAPEVNGQPLDLERVRLLGGLITKVQHNDLWEDFPFTRASLKLLGAELAFFADYRDEFLLARRDQPDRTARVGRFLDRLDRWLRSRSSPAAPVARDMASYERVHWQLGLDLVTAEAGPVTTEDEPVPTHEPATAPAGSGVRPNGLLRVHGFDHDPTEIMAVIRRAGDLADVRPRSTFLCFWARPEPREIRVVEIDPLAALVLDDLGHGIPVDDLQRRLHETDPEVSPDAVARVIDAAADHGMLIGDLRVATTAGASP